MHPQVDLSSVSKWYPIPNMEHTLVGKKDGRQATTTLEVGRSKSLVECPVVLEASNLSPSGDIAVLKHRFCNQQEKPTAIFCIRGMLAVSIGLVVTSIRTRKHVVCP